MTTFSTTASFQRIFSPTIEMPGSLLRMFRRKTISSHRLPKISCYGSGQRTRNFRSQCLFTAAPGEIELGRLSTTSSGGFWKRVALRSFESSAP